MISYSIRNATVGGTNLDIDNEKVYKNITADKLAKSNKKTIDKYIEKVGTKISSRQTFYTYLIK